MLKIVKVGKIIGKHCQVCSKSLDGIAAIRTLQLKLNAMKRILVPTDFSEHAYAAAEVAANIARKTDGRVYLLHVVDLLEYGDEEETAKQLFVMKLVRKRMHEMVTKPFFEGVNVVEALQFDMIYENVAKLANKNNIDLIVMGSHGASGIKELVFGSNTQKIVRMSECPVLTVKYVPQSFDFKNIVFASDFDREVESGLSTVKQFADQFGATIHLLRVCLPSDFEETLSCYEKMNVLASRVGLENYTTNVFNDRSLELGIRKFGKTVDADLTAMATHGREGLFHIVWGSRTEELVNHESMPILSVRIGD